MRKVETIVRFGLRSYSVRLSISPTLAVVEGLSCRPILRVRCLLGLNATDDSSLFAGWVFVTRKAGSLRSSPRSAPTPTVFHDLRTN